MDFGKFQEKVSSLKGALAGIEKADPAAMRAFAAGVRDALTDLLKARKESVRPGQLCKDAAAKNLIPGAIAPRLDALVIRWGGSVTPEDAHLVREDAEKMRSAAEKLIPVLEAYTKDRPE